MSEPISEDVILTGRGYLGDASESSESGCIENPVSISLTLGPLVSWAIIGVKPVIPAGCGHAETASALWRCNLKLAALTKSDVAIVDESPDSVHRLRV